MGHRSAINILSSECRSEGAPGLAGTPLPPRGGSPFETLSRARCDVNVHGQPVLLERVSVGVGMDVMTQRPVLGAFPESPEVSLAPENFTSAVINPVPRQSWDGEVLRSISRRMHSYGIYASLATPLTGKNVQPVYGSSFM
ncbi:hypothetical protein D8B26_002098 [Coccidioides posadasii str. Silveira]|uniref:Predicted protein n=2 Tax=Coccidioides posadasii TaxID=199306 RepID=E9CUU9_COCPS|nr:predicted protein [Coccidioides posadasii str. Silveira]KMM65462.1 hypothetical protein CPAG_01813 [Coccidioides posadasii RMSCC 3488]QVM07398.1 hypothetical protein D8B26_002098 [Coccidioides posadasii str. Silveira]